MITVKEITDKKGLKDYIKFPFLLYKNNPNWIPPLIKDEMETFDREENPAFLTAEMHQYLAYKDHKIVGRITVIINWTEVNNQHKKKVRFGWFDVIDDIEVTKALLEKAYELGRKHNLENVEGPMGFSNLDKVGALTEGFDQIGTTITWYNEAYYMKHFEQLGFVKEKEFLESRFSFANVSIEPFLKADELVRKRYGLNLLTFKSTKELMPHVDAMFDVFNTSYEKLSSFVAVSKIQIDYFKKKYLRFINPELILFIEDQNHKLVAFSIVMPSYTDAFKKANGKLFPFGFLHILNARKNSDEVLFYLIGILPEYQNKGVTAIIMKRYYEVFDAKGIKNCIRTPELEENHSIHNLWKNFDPIIHKRRCTYIKNL